MGYYVSDRLDSGVDLLAEGLVHNFSAVDELVEKIEEGWRCKPCGKISKSNTASSDIRRHAEIHIEGLSFDCQLCDKTFRSRHSLKNHKYDYHKKY